MHGVIRLSVGFVCLVLLAANAQQAYYPQQAGVSWFYDSGEQVFLERVPSLTFETFISETFVNREGISSDQVKVRVRRLGETEIAREVLSFSDAGVFLHGSTAGALSLIYDPPLLLYPPAPLEVGLTWRSETDVRSELRGSSESVPSENILGVTRVSLTGTVTGIQGIRSPLGNFNTFVVEQVSVVDTGDDPTESLRVAYFLPTLGVVAFNEDDRGQVVLEQTNFPIP